MGALWAFSRTAALQKVLPAAAKKGVHGVVGFVWLQVILGISTLLYLVPTHLASAHQAGSLALLTWTVVLGSRVWFPTQAARILAQRAQAGVASAGRSTGGGDEWDGETESGPDGHWDGAGGECDACCCGYGVDVQWRGREWVERTAPGWKKRAGRG